MKGSRPALPAGLLERFKRYQYVLLVILVGVVLLMLPSGTDREPSRSSGQESADLEGVQELERRLEQALSRVQGVGEATVVLTWKESARQVLAQDVERTREEETQSTVIVSQGSGVEQPVTLQQIGPRYQGALIVCDGGDDPGVKLAVLDAVRALTGLSADKIAICKRQ